MYSFRRLFHIDIARMLVASQDRTVRRESRIVGYVAINRVTISNIDGQGVEAFKRASLKAVGFVTGRFVKELM